MFQGYHDRLLCKSEGPNFDIGHRLDASIRIKKNVNIFRVSQFGLQILVRIWEEMVCGRRIRFLSSCSSSSSHPTFSSSMIQHWLPSLLAHLPRCAKREEKFVAWARKQQRRRAKVAKGCASDLGWMDDQWERSPNKKQAHFVYNTDHKILACLQPKVTDHLTDFRFIFTAKQILNCPHPEGCY